MPNGAVAPGKVWPSGPVPIMGSTSLSGSGTWAKPIEQANSRVKQRRFFILRKYRILFVRGAAYENSLSSRGVKAMVAPTYMIVELRWGDICAQLLPCQKSQNTALDLIAGLSN